SARSAGAKIANPVVSADGQQLRFALGTLDAAAQVQLTYVTEVTAATPLGTSINRAQGFAYDGTASNVATAQVEIASDLLQDVNTIIGRVLIGCGNDAKVAPVGMGGARVLMETGAYAVADAEGRYHFDAVRNGTHVLQLDTASLPEGYAVDACEKNTRFAGRSYSQFVELHGGALWHADFHVRRLPPPRGEVVAQLVQQADAGIIHNTLDVTVSKVPVDKLSATVMLPAGARYVAGSATLNGAVLPAPNAMDGALVFRLEDRAAGWHGTVKFDLRTDGTTPQPSTTMALVGFDTAGAAPQHLPPLTAVLGAAGVARSAPQRAATLGVAAALPVAAAKKG
ncbi:MAG TPA: hypothetical protein VFX03_07065, partial [Thermomicrobiales bacterium]|nr:hypothetical protein [Thermomicrobiales bacterium]